MSKDQSWCTMEDVEAWDRKHPRHSQEKKRAPKSTSRSDHTKRFVNDDAVNVVISAKEGREY